MSIKGFIYRLRLANYNRWLSVAERIGKWALLNKLDLMGYPQRDRVGALLDREIAAIAPSVEAYLTHQRTEIEILSARLSRRYDPGAALNEATERAIKDKKLVAAAHVVTEGLLMSERGDDAPKPGDPDFWEKEAARQRKARALQPEPLLELTKTQEDALEAQKKRASILIRNS